MSVSMLGHLAHIFVHLSVCLYIHQCVGCYSCMALHLSLCPLGLPGGIYVFVRHTGVCQYNYLFMCSAVVCRLTIVHGAYLIETEGTGGSMWQLVIDIQQSWTWLEPG